MAHVVLVSLMFIFFKILTGFDKETMKSEALEFSPDMAIFFDKKTFVFFNMEDNFIEITALVVLGEPLLSI